MARKNKSRTKKGGYTPSAWDYVMSTVGNGATQAQNSLVLQPGESIPASKSLDIEPINNPNAQFAQPYLAPNMTGGKRGRRTKKGGSWAGTLNTALVPFSIWGMQYFSKKRKGSGKGRRSRKTKTRKFR